MSMGTCEILPSEVPLNRGMPHAFIARPLRNKCSLYTFAAELAQMARYIREPKLLKLYDVIVSGHATRAPDNSDNGVHIHKKVSRVQKPRWRSVRVSDCAKMPQRHLQTQILQKMLHQVMKNRAKKEALR